MNNKHLFRTTTTTKGEVSRAIYVGLEEEDNDLQVFQKPRSTADTASDEACISMATGASGREWEMALVQEEGPVYRHQPHVLVDLKRQAAFLASHTTQRAVAG